MMGQQRGGQKQLFYSFNLDDHVPSDHLLRGIDRFLDLGDLRSAKIMDAVPIRVKTPSRIHNFMGKITIGKFRKWSCLSMVRAASLCNWRMYQLSRSKISLLVK